MKTTERSLIELKGILDTIIARPTLLHKPLWCEYIPHPVSWDGGDFYISLPGQAFNKGVYQSKGYIELSSQIPLSRAVVIVYFLKELKISNVLRVHLNEQSAPVKYLHFMNLASQFNGAGAVNPS